MGSIWNTCSWNTFVVFCHLYLAGMKKNDVFCIKIHFRTHRDGQYLKYMYLKYVFEILLLYFVFCISLGWKNEMYFVSKYFQIKYFVYFKYKIHFFHVNLFSTHFNSLSDNFSKAQSAIDVWRPNCVLSVCHLMAPLGFLWAIISGFQSRRALEITWSQLHVLHQLPG